MSDPDRSALDPRIAGYLKARGNVPVPHDLLTTARVRRTEKRSTLTSWRPWFALGGALAAAAVVIVAVAVIVGGLGRNGLLGASPAPTSGAGSSASPSSSGSPTPAPSGLASVFPASVLGMPVISVTEANAMRANGQLDGRAVAVSGWYHLPLAVPCPAPIQYTSPLEEFCHFEILSTVDFDRRVCAKVPPCQLIGPNPPGVAFLEPFFMRDTAGTDAARNGPFDESDPTSHGIPVVLIGHAGDPRLWHCAVQSRGDCRRAFVVDRVAWVAGDNIDLEPRDIQMATGVPGELLSVIEIPAGEAPELDPRLHGVGGALVRVVRSIRADAQPKPGPTRAVDVTEIADDQVLASFPLEMDSGYRPARLDVQFSERNDASDEGGLYPFYRVEQPDGSGLWEAMLGQRISRSGGRTVYRPDMPVILEPGHYVIRGWRATVELDTVGEPQDECSTEIDLVALDEVLFEAAFPRRGPCTWGVGVPLEPF